ncbi:MAG: 2Fe-2S iron-sulfur cluster binding domain-containing protein [Gorillibacterium sp.]|nr:2Fe-2S iron-sulfur cluster binding domain-containing protein [Gorillibacterium sp.]
MANEVIFLPDDVRVEVRKGTNLLDAARKAKVNVRSRCAGKAGCLMCKVKVNEQSNLLPMTKAERLKLGSLANQNIRLACQAIINGNVEVQVPEDPLKAAVRAQLARQKEEDLW